MNFRRHASSFALLVLAASQALSCTRQEATTESGLKVVTTLFPLFDISRSIAGDRAQVSMLLPPAVEPHAYEPRPEDVIRISRSGLFVYTGKHMERWAERIISGIESSTLRVTAAGEGISHMPGSTKHDHVQRHQNPSQGEKKSDHDNLESGAPDPHIWLDFSRAAIMTDNILKGFIAADPSNAEYYSRNAKKVIERLVSLDERYRTTLATCSSRKLLHGGHYTFGYLARRYNLEYVSLSGISSEAEPSAARMISLIREINKTGASHIFTEELLSPRLAESLAKESGVVVLLLHGAHNASKEEIAANRSFFDMMEYNLEQLQKGLKCRKQP